MYRRIDHKNSNNKLSGLSQILKIYPNREQESNNQLKDPMEIIIKVTDEKNHKCEQMKFEHTEHSFNRSVQRGIDSKKISAAIEYGEDFYKQGMVYYILGEKNIPETLEKERNSLKNIVVIISGDSNKVITCYRSKNPFKHIKTKSKRLYTNYNTAA